MSAAKVRSLLFAVLSVLICAALLLSGCARFDGVVDFTADPASGKAPLAVQFTPMYTDAGTYTVILMVIPRRGEPASVIKEDYIRAHSGFGSIGRQLVVQDDEFNLDELPSAVNPPGTTEYLLDVLENDVRGDGGGQLTIVGVRTPWEDTYEYGCITDSYSSAWLNPEGTAIWYESDDYTQFPDSFYYLATDGVTTAEGKVTIDRFDYWDWPWDHP